ncbi:MAG: hypothetical protein ACI9HE_001885 [Planctomycetota bacterium]|jgi:hypothetical protein
MIRSLLLAGFLLQPFALAQSGADPEVVLEAALGTPSTGAPDNLHDAFAGRDGDLDSVFEALGLELAEDASGSPERVAEARRLRAWLRWRDGDLDGATEDFAVLAAADPAGDSALSHARLLDASGKAKEALDAYRTLADARAGGPDEDWLRLRMALMEMELGGDEAKGSLATHAMSAGTDPDLANRAAVLLALMGRPGDAIDVFQVPSDPKGAFRGELRVAEWGLRSDQPEIAQAAAWRAVKVAGLKRDRRYALAVLLEAHRADESEAALIERFAAEAELSADERSTWIALLRETDRYSEAIELFAGDRADRFSPEERLELLEMYRQADRVDEMLAAYGQLIADEPAQLTWREGLSRHHLERGDTEAAEATWNQWLAADAAGGDLLDGARVLSDLGLDGLALAATERHLELGASMEEGLLFLFELERGRGDLIAAAQVLERLDANAVPDAPVRYQLSECWEQLGDPARAASTLETVVAARGLEEAGEDVAMRLAWLYSELGDEDRALDAWGSLAERVNSIPRRRYVEDRLMTVAARLGRLADIAVDLETKLMGGTANEREANLLVRLYSKVNDAVSAAEVIDEFLKTGGKSEVEALQEKGRVYLACTDYYNYERTVKRLMKIDPEGHGDYLRQMAMSQLERGKPDEARKTLAQLQGLENDSVGAEFEAGVLTLAGLRDEAAQAYRKGLAENPERIDSYLLMAGLYRELGRADEAVGMFQYLAETASKDDLFTVSIDGLLNQLVDAPPRPKMLAWARRQALERLARRNDKSYLYQLLADLAEEAEDGSAQLDALEYSLAIAGPRRGSVLRELMDLAKADMDIFSSSEKESDKDRQLAYGRRLIGLGELVPPDVFLDLGEVFLDAEDVSSAVKTFEMARDLPDPVVFRRQTAALLETSGYEQEGLEAYSKVLATRPTDVGLLVKVAEMEEALGSDERARPLYARALELMLGRKPLVESDSEEEEEDDSNSFLSFSRNVDEYDSFHARAITGWLATSDDLQLAAADLAAWRSLAMGELELGRATFGGVQPPTQIEQYPRLAIRAQLHRQRTLALGQIAAADEMDAELIGEFPEDEDLIEAAVDARVRRGQARSAQALVEGANLEADRRAELMVRAGRSAGALSGSRIPLAEGLRQLLPMAVAGDTGALALFLRRIDLTGLDVEQLPEMAALFSAARWTGDQDLCLFIAREWVRHGMAQGQQSYQLESTLDSCASALTDEGRRSLYQYFVGLILKDTEKGSSFVRMLPELSEKAGGDLLSSEQVAEIMENYGERYAYGLGPVLALMDPAERAGAMRGLWPKIEETSRADFLLGLINDMRAGTGPELADFIVEAFAESLPKARSYVSYSIGRMSEAEANFDVILRLDAALESKFPGSAMNLAIRLHCLNKLERTEEALAMVGDTWLALVQGDASDYNQTRAQREILEQYLPEHVELFFGVAQAAMEEDATKELALAMVELAVKAELDERQLELMNSALAQFPEEVSVLQRARGVFSSLGDRPRAFDMLERVIALESETDEKVRKERLTELADGWRALEHWPHVWEVTQRIDALGLGDEEEVGIPGYPAGFKLPPNALIVVNGVVVRFGDVKAKGLPKSIAKMKESLEAGKPEEARATLRRFWRTFKAGEVADRYGSFGRGASPLANAVWPADKDDAEPSTEEQTEKDLLARGGLDAYRDKDPEKEEPGMTAFEHMAQHAPLVEEMTRFLRTRSSSQLSRLQGLFEGLLAARVAEFGPTGALQGLLQEARSGSGGKAEAAMLLALLDKHPDLINEEVDEHLAGLVRGVDPKDAVQVRRLARVWARAGRVDDALRLYRWCATRVSGGRNFFGGDDGSSTVSASELVEEAQEVLEGEQCLALVEDILHFAKPPENPWQMGYFENLVLDTWREMVGPREALGRARAIAEKSIDLGQGLRRDTAKRAAGLFASSGEIDNALRALEIGLCELPDEGIAQPTETWYRKDPSRPGSLGTRDLRNLFPADSSDWTEPVVWLQRAADALHSWGVDERFPVERTYRAQALIAVRLFDLGEVGAARTIVGRLGDGSLESESAALWVADAARHVGQDDLQIYVESELLKSGRLRVARMAQLIEQVRESKGATEALALGTGALELSRSDELLTALLGCAQEIQDEFGTARWGEFQTESRAAKAALDARKAERKAEREAKANAPG